MESDKGFFSWRIWGNKSESKSSPIEGGFPDVPGPWNSQGSLMIKVYEKKTLFPLRPYNIRKFLGGGRLRGGRLTNAIINGLS